MNNQEPKNSTKEIITRIAKQIIKESGYHPPRFFIELPNGRVAQVQMGADEKAEMIDALGRVVKQSKTNRYYSVFDAKMVYPEDIKKHARKIIKEAKEQPNASNTLSRLVQLTNKPSSNPVAKDVLIISTYDKSIGMDKDLYEYKRTKNGSTTFKQIFNKESKYGHTYDPFNVWTPHQINLGK